MAPFLGGPYLVTTKFFVATPEGHMEPDVLDDREVLWRPHPGPQTRFLQSTQFEVLYGGALGGGKALQLSASVATGYGWKRVRDLRVGDTILHPSGFTQSVVLLHPVETRDYWRVTLHDGETLDVSGEHLWQAWRSGKSVKRRGSVARGYDSRQVVTTAQLKDWVDVAVGQKARGLQPNWPLIPVSEELQYTGANSALDRWGLGLDPYLLGYILGDGCISVEGQVSLAVGSEDMPALERYLTSVGLDYGIDPRSLRLRGDGRAKVWAALERWGLALTKSESKFIPKEMLFRPAKERWALLQGLMDTDGTAYERADRGGVRFEYCTVSKQLAVDVSHLVRSLGGVATVREKETHYLDDAGERVPCRNAFVIEIKHRTPGRLFRLDRKIEVALKASDPIMYRRVVSVEPIGKRTGRCITVSNPDGLFIASDGEDPSGFVVTHNSDALLFGGLRHISKPHYKAVFIRHTYPALQEMIDRSFVFKRLGGEWNASEKRWTFPSGAIYEFKYFERWEHHANFQGHQYQYIAWDEIGLCPEERFWVFLATRCRSPRDAEVIPQMVASANPGGAGHAWVKRRWVDKCGIAGEHVYVDPDTGLDRRFIPARLTDNPTLLKNDPQYLRVLHGLPEMMQRQLLEGDWGAAVGMALGELDEKTHIITKEDPRFSMNPWGRFFGAFDWGYSHPASFGFFEERPGKQLVLVDSLSMWRKTPIEIAERVEDKAYQLGAELGMKDRPLPLDMVYASRDCFNVQKARGEDIATIAEHFHDVGMTMTMANQNRIHGLNNLRQYVTVIGPERTLVEPKLLIRDTPTNREVFDCLEGMVVDPKDPEDALKVDADEYGLGGDDPYDMVRYGCASRPLVVRAPREKPKKPRDYDHGGDAAFQRMGEVYKRTRRFHGMGIRG